MGRPRKYVDEGTDAHNVTTDLDMVMAGTYPREQLPALLADAKREGDAPLIAAILKACNG